MYEEKEGSAAEHKIKKKKKREREREFGKGCLAKDHESPPWE